MLIKILRSARGAVTDDRARRFASALTDNCDNAGEKGLKAGGLFVIDARVSPSTMADSYAKVNYGEANRAPLLRRLARSG